MAETTSEAEEEQARRARVRAGRWFIRRVRDGSDTPWTVYTDAWESLDQNTDLACIENGQWSTREEALVAFEECMELLRKGEY